MSTNPETIEATEPVVQRQNPKWVGLIMAWVLPGSAHFLSGQYCLGILLYLAGLLLGFFTVRMLCMGFIYVTFGLCVVTLLVFVAVLISSWRPTHRLGCFGWILFVGVFFCSNHAIRVSGILDGEDHVKQFAMNGMAMAPTLVAPSEFAPEIQYRDRIVVNMWIYRMSDPQRGDVVVFEISPDGSPQNWGMRIVGLPGETVDIESPYVLINGERLTEPPIFAKIADRQDGFSGYCTAQEVAGIEGVPLPLTLGADEYFLLGDNSPQSKDSRFDGPVRRQDIIGKVIRIFYPFDRMREVE